MIPGNLLFEPNHSCRQRVILSRGQVVPLHPNRGAKIDGVNILNRVCGKNVTNEGDRLLQVGWQKLQFDGKLDEDRRRRNG